MTPGIDQPTAIIRIHEILAADAGIPRQNRLWNNFAADASVIVADYRRKRLAPDGPIAAVLEEHGARMDHENAIRAAAIEARRAVIDQQREKSSTPAGSRDISVRDEASGELLRLRIPENMILT